MSVRRLSLTSAAMAAVAFLLGWATPDLPVMGHALVDAQRTADTAGADVLLLSAAGLTAWAVWAWGVLGLALTAASLAPGLIGSSARLLVRVVLPSGARRGAALALGIGLGVAAPVLVGVPQDSGRPVLAAAVTPVTVTPAGVPDWPAEQTASAHVVVPGDCLWDIASGRLGAAPTDAEIAAAVPAWWSVNAEVIGPDPDLILPGQVLRPPDQS
jgi:hypothetical protein